jgi:hypothetical protein
MFTFFMLKQQVELYIKKMQKKETTIIKIKIINVCLFFKEKKKML